MKAEDLMIGAWVQNPSGKFLRVEGIGMRESSNILLSDARYYSEEEIKPVPLDNEIIRKNHFVGIDETEFFSYEGLFEVRIIRGNIDSYFLSLYESNPDGDFNLSMRIEYVHELQKAYQLCRIQNDFRL